MNLSNVSKVYTHIHRVAQARTQSCGGTAASRRKVMWPSQMLLPVISIKTYAPDVNLMEGDALWVKRLSTLSLQTHVPHTLQIILMTLITKQRSSVCLGNYGLGKWEYIMCGKDYNQPANMGTMNNQRPVLFINREFCFRPKSSVTVSAG